MAALMARTFPTSVGGAAASLDRDAEATAEAVDAASVDEEVGGVTSLLGTLSSSPTRVTAAAAFSSEVSEGKESLTRWAAEEGGDEDDAPRRFALSRLLRL